MRKSLSILTSLFSIPIAIACGGGSSTEPPAVTGGDAAVDAIPSGDAASGGDDGGGGPTDAAGDASSAPPMAPFPADGALFGAFVNQGTTTPEAVAQELGRPLAFEMAYFAWGDDFSTAKQGWLPAVLARRAIPELSWQLDGSDDCSGVHFDDVTTGAQDNVIRAAARALKAVAPSWVLLRPWWEMNGGWYCTNVKHQSTPGTCDGTQKYVAAWRHVHDLFVSEGATNVRWIWAPSHQDPGDSKCNHWSLYYPGDAYVDAVGVDGYNKFRIGDGGGPDANMPWTSFHDIFQPIYDEYATKPFIVAETASAEDPATDGRKAQWITDALAAMKTMPRLKAFTWFIKGPVKGDPDDYSLCTSQGAFDAYAAMANDPFFGGTGAKAAYTCR